MKFYLQITQKHLLHRCKWVNFSPRDLLLKLLLWIFSSLTSSFLEYIFVCEHLIFSTCPVSSYFSLWWNFDILCWMDRLNSYTRLLIGKHFILFSPRFGFLYFFFHFSFSLRLALVSNEALINALSTLRYLLRDGIRTNIYSRGRYWNRKKITIPF